jgi:hypothetical protein
MRKHNISWTDADVKRLKGPGRRRREREPCGRHFEATEGVRSSQGPVTGYALSLGARGERKDRRSGGNEPLPKFLTVMKYLKWCESVDHLVIPFAVDVVGGHIERCAGHCNAALHF